MISKTYIASLTEGNTELMRALQEDPKRAFLAHVTSIKKGEEAVAAQLLSTLMKIPVHRDLLTISNFTDEGAARARGVVIVVTLDDRIAGINA